MKSCAQEEIVKQHYTDHELLEINFLTNIGYLSVFSLNLLIRQSLSFLKMLPDEEIIPRLNCPLAWYLENPLTKDILRDLNARGLMLTSLETPVAQGKVQLRLVDLEHGTPIYQIPEVERYFLETEDEYADRLNVLLTLINDKMSTAIRTRRTLIFCLQELCCAELPLRNFKNKLSSNLDISYAEHTGNKIFMPAIIYCKDSLAPIDSNIDQVIQIKQKFSDLISNNSADYIGQLHVQAFRTLDTDSSIVIVACFHGNFVTVNKAREYELTEVMRNLAQEFGVIIAGDFNQIVKGQKEIKNIEKDKCASLHKSTTPGLQLHDTFDAIFIPYRFLAFECDPAH